MQDYDVALDPHDRMLLDALMRLDRMDAGEMAAYTGGLVRTEGEVGGVLFAGRRALACAAGREHAGERRYGNQDGSY